MINSMLLLFKCTNKDNIMSQMKIKKIENKSKKHVIYIHALFN